MEHMPAYDQLTSLEDLGQRYGVDPLMIQIEYESVTLPDGFISAKVDGKYFTIAPDGRYL